MNDLIRIAGIVWYRAEDYESILKIMEDSAKLPMAYKNWLTQAESNEKLAHKSGFSTVRAFIDPKTFPDWCRRRGYNINAKARMEYANLIAKESDGNI